MCRLYMKQLRRLHLRSCKRDFRDILYLASYRDERGEVIVQHSDYIKDVFQPGAVTRLEVNDGMITVPFVSATIEVVGAEALLPIR